MIKYANIVTITFICSQHSPFRFREIVIITVYCTKKASHIYNYSKYNIDRYSTFYKLRFNTESGYISFRESLKDINISEDRFE
jgi:hypothetical protein